MNTTKSRRFSCPLTPRPSNSLTKTGVLRPFCAQVLPEGQRESERVSLNAQTIAIVDVAPWPAAGSRCLRQAALPVEGQRVHAVVGHVADGAIEEQLGKVKIRTLQKAKHAAPAFTAQS